MNVVPPSSASGPATSAEPPTPQADWASMRQHFAPQPGMLSALIGVAHQTLPGVAQQLHLALQDEDAARLAKVAHEIKGIALNLRAPGLTELAAHTQDLARKAAPEAIDSGQRLRTHLSGFMAQLTSVASAPSVLSGAQ